MFVHYYNRLKLSRSTSIGSQTAYSEHDLESQLVTETCSAPLVRLIETDLTEPPTTTELILITGPLHTKSILSKSVWIGPSESYTHKLYRCIRRHITTSHRWIIEYFKQSQDKDDSYLEFLLVVIAMELHCGRTVLFYKMLEVMKDNSQHLATEIQHKVETFDASDSYGMCTVSYMHTY